MMDAVYGELLRSRNCANDLPTVNDVVISVCLKRELKNSKELKN